MREIKFRAWDKVDEEMVSVSAIALEKNSFDTKHYFYGSQPHFYDEHNDLHVLEECELMQYTGLKDKNGVEIYEGDVIQAHCGTSVIYWDNEHCGFYMRYIPDEEILDMAEFWPESVIIGNKWDNPDMLDYNVPVCSCDEVSE